MQNKKLLLLLFAGINIGLVQTQEQQHYRWNYSHYLPASWEQITSSDAEHTQEYVSANNRLYFKVEAFQSYLFKNVMELHQSYVQQNIISEESIKKIRYIGYDAILTTVQFVAPLGRKKGWIYYLLAAQTAYVLSSYGEPNMSPFEEQALLSNLDSFAAGSDGAWLPGPISSIFIAEQPEEFRILKLRIAENNISINVDMRKVRATEELIRREENILARGQDNDFIQFSLERFYRLIFRSSFEQLQPIMNLLKAENPDSSKYELAQLLIYWLQDMTVGRKTELAKITAPMQALLDGRGNEDSLGLVYVALMANLSIPNAILVSKKFKHSVIGSAIKGPGARFSWQNSNYLLAELTEKIYIGWVIRNTAYLQDWFPIIFPYVKNIKRFS